MKTFLRNLRYNIPELLLPLKLKDFRAEFLIKTKQLVPNAANGAATRASVSGRRLKLLNRCLCEKTTKVITHTIGCKKIQKQGYKGEKGKALAESSRCVLQHSHLDMTPLSPLVTERDLGLLRAGQLVAADEAGR